MTCVILRCALRGSFYLKLNALVALTCGIILLKLAMMFVLFAS